MAASAFVLGFFTSFGWWTANKVQKIVDPPAIVRSEEKNGC